MPELNEEEKQSSHSPDNSSPSYFEKSSPNGSAADEESSGSCQESPVSSSFSEEYTAMKPQYATQVEEAVEFARDDKLEYVTKMKEYVWSC